MLYPRLESNQYLILRRDLFYPLNYRGYVEIKNSTEEPNVRNANYFFLELNSWTLDSKLWFLDSSFQIEFDKLFADVEKLIDDINNKIKKVDGEINKLIKSENEKDLSELNNKKGKLMDLRMELTGTISLNYADVFSGSPPSLLRRLGSMNWELYSTTSKQTKTHEKTLNISKEKYEQVLNKFKKLQ